MPVQQTSIDAYYALTGLSLREARVAALLKDEGPMCNRDIAAALDEPINVITPRVFKLRQDGLVEESHRAKHPVTNVTVIYWKTV